jgi:Tol biopolymer transport system component
MIKNSWGRKKILKGESMKRKRINGKAQVNRTIPNISSWLIVIIFLFIIAGCSNDSSGDFHEGIISPRFSIDNKKIIFGYCSGTKKDTKCDLVTYVIATGGIYRFNPTGNISHGSPVYSPDGKRITFTAGDTNKWKNIYLVNTDELNVKQLTNVNKPKPVSNGKDVNLRFDSMPSFSPDGKRIIFKRAVIKREHALPMHSKMLSHWDVYETDIKTGEERRLTNYSFYEMSKPSYMPDGKRFIFPATGPKDIPGQAPFNADEYKKRYKDNNIFIMDDEKNILRPAFVNGWYSTDPSVSQDGTILFSSVTNEMDGLPRDPYNYDLFIWKNGNIKRLTKFVIWMRG